MSDAALPTVTFRPGRPGDREMLERFLAAADLPIAGVADHLGDFLIAVAAGGVAGTAAVERYAPYGLLRSVAVDDSHRGLGLGTLLVQRAIQHARRHGLVRLYLLTTTASDYFPRFGFLRVNRADLPKELSASEELKGACPDTAVCMELRLVS